VVELKVPELGESVMEATVGRWLKKVGDAVSAGEAVVELETDKVNLEVTAETDGVLQTIVAPEGANWPQSTMSPRNPLHRRRRRPHRRPSRHRRQPARRSGPVRTCGAWRESKAWP
jgi:hypothetical protein